jgi:flagellar assembly factor FliW
MTQAYAAPAAVERFRVSSRFADVEVDPRDIVTFPDGLPGYEGMRLFALLDLPETAPLRMLHAVNAPEPCFLVVDPKSVLPGYRCEIASADRLRLGASDESVLLWLAIVMVHQNGDVSANLRAPIVINPERMVGRQVMPSGCVYPVHQVIAPRS